MAAVSVKRSINHNTSQCCKLLFPGVVSNHTYLYFTVMCICSFPLSCKVKNTFLKICAILLSSLLKGHTHHLLLFKKTVCIPRRLIWFYQYLLLPVQNLFLILVSQVWANGSVQYIWERKSIFFSGMGNSIIVKSKVYIWAKYPIRQELIPVSVAWSIWESFNSILNRMLVQCRVTPSNKFADTHLYT